MFVILASSGISNWVGPAGRGSRPIFVVATAMFAMIVIPLTGIYWKPILWPATPQRIKAYVESFDKAPFSSASWHQWEIVASWAVEAKLDPDLSAPRRLLATELAGEQNPYILASAFRVGLMRADQLGQLKEYETLRRFLLDDPYHITETQQIWTPDWIIYASALAGDLTREQRDHLEKRLNFTLDARLKEPLLTLESLLRLTQLLEVIGRPVEVDRYRDRMHETLRKFHSTTGGGSQLAGGFKSYNGPKFQVGSPDATSMAVELMSYYGVPANLELDWVRSYLKPLSFRPSPYQWIAAVTLDRLNQLPGVTQPGWLKSVYYERSLLAAVILVGLSIYATLVSPLPGPRVATDGQTESPPGSALE